MVQIEKISQKGIIMRQLCEATLKIKLDSSNYKYFTRACTWLEKAGIKLNYTTEGGSNDGLVIVYIELDHNLPENVCLIFKNFK